MQIDITLNVANNTIMLSVVMLNVIVLSVAAFFVTLNKFQAEKVISLKKVILWGRSFWKNPELWCIGQTLLVNILLWALIVIEGTANSGLARWRKLTWPRSINLFRNGFVIFSHLQLSPESEETLVNVLELGKLKPCTQALD